MKTNLIQIGNSKGIRIPKALIEQFQLTGEIELISLANGLLISPSLKPRSKWEDLFKASVVNEKESGNSDWQTMPNRFDKEEWSW